MDFILPSDDTMELMREEFAKLKKDSLARAFALSNNRPADNADADNEAAPIPAQNRVGETKSGEAPGAYITPSAVGILLLLYFVKHLSYNINYGTQIFNTHRGLEQIRPNQSYFGKLNNLD